MLFRHSAPARLRLMTAAAFTLFSAGAQAALAQTPAQTPSPAPQRTGRSYGGGDTMKTPPPPGPVAPSPVTFADITAQTRIAFRQAASVTSQKYLLESMGGGVAMFDYDNDGRLDLYFTNGARLDDPMPKG
ncbi:MAG TPA: hypothetical protein VD861_12845, partial [Pyrinomonadaceae bacterium]|nr:hypothetical protein [Pyrinomonadaceae bacterium]